MTLDEAIAHAREVAEEQRKACDLAWVWDNPDNIKKCAEEHEQLAEWLEELKRYREEPDGYLWDHASNQGYLKAVDDFVKEYKSCDNRSIQCKKFLNCADCIAEQLKAGITND